MKGLMKFLGETWWLFVSAAIAAVVMAFASGFWFYLFFLPVLCVMALYMSAVRYDSEGNVRGEDRE